MLHRSKGKSPKIKADTTGKVYRKQGLEVPYDDKESLGGEPIGNVDPENTAGIDGLGGDMHGFPTGMGAGAEPLGAFDQSEGPNNFQESMPQGLDEGAGPGLGPGPGSMYGAPVRFQKDGPPMGFGDQGTDGQRGDFFEGRSLPEIEGPGAGGFRPIDPGPSGPSEDNEAQSVLGPQQVQGFLNPPPAMDESMSNNLGAMDKANVQGDSDVADMVRGRQNSMQQLQSEQSMDPSITGNGEASFTDQNKNPYDDGMPSEEYKNIKSEEMMQAGEMMRHQQHLVGNKRILRKNKRKQEKFKGFKTLQKKHG